MSFRTRREIKPTAKFLSYCEVEFKKKSPVVTPINEPEKHLDLKPIKSQTFYSSPAKEIIRPASQDESPKRKIDDEYAASAKRRSGRPPKPTQKLIEFHISENKDDNDNLDSPSSPLVHVVGTNHENSGESTFGTKVKDYVIQKKPVAKRTLSQPVKKVPARSSNISTKQYSTYSKTKISKTLSFPLCSVRATKMDILPSKVQKKEALSSNAAKKVVKTAPNDSKFQKTTFKPQRTISTFATQARSIQRGGCSRSVTTNKPQQTINIKTTTFKERQGRTLQNTTTQPLGQIKKSLHMPLHPIKMEHLEKEEMEQADPVILNVSPEAETVTDKAKEMRQTLKKFLLMGTKVAQSITESLNHNEENLLSGFSSFENKCISLVNAIAEHGKGLEEEDMEKILNLLDEEQEERRAYRQCLLESLKISHLTNMALYTQMLKLLKSL